MRRNVFSSPVFLLKAVASVLYIFIGIILFLNPLTLTFLDKTWNQLLGVLLLVYGCYRAWRLQNEYRKNL